MALGYSGADILDINMGRPVGKVVKSGDGSALMKSPELAGRIIEAVVAAVDKPVTVKFRKGWDNGGVNAVEFAKICEQAGRRPSWFTAVPARRCTQDAPTGTSSAT